MTTALEEMVDALERVWTISKSILIIETLLTGSLNATFFQRRGKIHKPAQHLQGKHSLESHLEGFHSHLLTQAIMSLASLTVTKRRHHFLSELVWCIRRWPELSAKKDFLSLTSGEKPVTKKYLLNPHFPQPGFNSLVSSTYSLLCVALWILNFPLHFSSRPPSVQTLLTPCHSISTACVQCSAFFFFFYLMLCPVIRQSVYVICII